MEPWADSFSGYNDPCLNNSCDATSQMPLMFPDLWPLEVGGVYAPPLLYSAPDHLSPPLADEDMLGVAAPLPACLDPFAWQGGDALAAGPVPSLWPNGDGAHGGLDMVPSPPQPGVAPFYADSPAWQAAPRGGGYRASQRTTPPPRRTPHRHHYPNRQPAPPASRPLAAAAPAVKRSHSGTPLGPRKSRAAGPARRASSSSTSVAAAAAVASSDRPPAAVGSGDTLPGALQGLVAMEQGLRSATHEQQRLLSATYEQWDRRRLSSATA